MSTDPILTVSGITKTFPGVTALDNVSFDIRRGEVHALVGENGAGKSTLMKVLAGLHQPDGGQILHRGQPVSVQSPLEARQMGILLIHQELSLSPELSVAENIYLGAWPTNALGVLNKRKLRRDARAALEALGCGFGPDRRVGTLSVAMQQMVEIARSQAFSADVVIFDEPTASLTDTEKDQLFATIRELRGQGVGIVYISHKMDEIFELTDRITVLRDGTVQGTVPSRHDSHGDHTGMNDRRTLAAFSTRPRSRFAPHPAGRGLGLDGQVDDVHFASAGEVGLYGRRAGRPNCRAIFACTPGRSGRPDRQAGIPAACARARRSTWQALCRSRKQGLVLMLDRLDHHHHLLHLYSLPPAKVMGFRPGGCRSRRTAGGSIRTGRQPVSDPCRGHSRDSCGQVLLRRIRG